MRPSALVLLLLLVALPMTVLAAWPPDGSPLSLAPNNQQYPTIVTDGASGAIVAWQDARNGTADIYVRKVTSTGVAQWTADGVALCVLPGDQYEPRLVADGAGGAIVVWYDYRGGSTADIYAQRVDAMGTPLWTVDGVAICTAAKDQYLPATASDGNGGAIIAWQDIRGTGYDIYAQRVNSAGVVQWTADGVAICTATNTQNNATVADDGAGGAIIAWEDVRGGAIDVYAQRVDALGAAQWTANGVVVTSASSGQISPIMVSDGANGAIVAWRDGRNGPNTDVYAQRVNGFGTPQWTANGVAICTAASYQLGIALVSDGAQGAIVTWQDGRGGPYDVYAQSVNATGTVQWMANGIAVCNATGDQYFPGITTDGAGGAIITWSDFRSTTILEAFTQRLNSLGVAQWTANGVSLSNSTGDKSSPTIVSDGVGGAIVSWYESRSSNPSDIYAQRLNASGQIPTGVSGATPSASLRVSDAYPNPFSSNTWMDLDLASPAAVKIDIFDVTGRRVRTIAIYNVHVQRVEFDGRDGTNRLLPSGIYFYRVQAAGETITRKMVIAR